MQTTIETPIRVEKLPVEVRANLPEGTIVRVSLEVLRDENGLTPEQAEELWQAMADADRGIGLSPVFNNALALNAYVRAEGEKVDE